MIPYTVDVRIKTGCIVSRDDEYFEVVLKETRRE